MKPEKENIYMAYSDEDGNVFDYPGITPAFRSGNRFVRVDEKDLISLPYGSYLFSLPQRYPVFFNKDDENFNHIEMSPEKKEICAVSSFLASAYLRTYLPAYINKDKSPMLPLWAYAGLVIRDGNFFVPAVRIDDDPRSDPEIHENDDELKSAIKNTRGLHKDNRLVGQLEKCSTEYNCLCARNFFLSRYEAPIPTTPSCNAGCIGCLSRQDDGSPVEPSQMRLDFKPTPEEISRVILHHIESTDNAVVSFGQGCEGEPLLRARDLAESINIVRKKTSKGTINLNTNASLPDSVKLMIDAGLDSIRVSMNSPTEQYYNRFYNPGNYSLNDVKKSLERALKSGIFVSLNLFFFPGFTDMESEVDALFKLLNDFPVDMIQTRNLNIDPDYYLRMMEFQDSSTIGIVNLLELIREKHGEIRLGYYNPSVKK
ncbi:radical SAM protein [Spirochaetota bacterium]